MTWMMGQAFEGGPDNSPCHVSFTIFFSNLLMVALIGPFWVQLTSLTSPRVRSDIKTEATTAWAWRNGVYGFGHGVSVFLN